MKFQLNLFIAWLWIWVGIIAGLALGLNFHRENWLGGYTSFKRRMYRLAHISFFGLGAVNLLFWLTMKTFPTPSSLLAVASWALVVGAITMPVCCVLMAHFPKMHLIFSVPVISLLAGTGLTLLAVMRGGYSHGAAQGGQSSVTALCSRELGSPGTAGSSSNGSVAHPALRFAIRRDRFPPLPAGKGEVFESHSRLQSPHASPSDHFNLLEP